MSSLEHECPSTYHIDKTIIPYYSLNTMVLSYRSLIMLLLGTLLFYLTAHRFMLIRIRENSMAPTLIDGQWVIVLKGGNTVRKGDIVLFNNPKDSKMNVKRLVLTSNETPLIEHGWLITPWGNWFLTPKEWQMLKNPLSNNKPNSFFLLGDNQFHSLDSRTYGFVDKTWIIGRVLLSKHW